MSETDTPADSPSTALVQHNPVCESYWVRVVPGTKTITITLEQPSENEQLRELAAAWERAAYDTAVYLPNGIEKPRSFQQAIDLADKLNKERR